MRRVRLHVALYVEHEKYQTINDDKPLEEVKKNLPANQTI